MDYDKDLKIDPKRRSLFSLGLNKTDGKNALTKPLGPPLHLKLIPAVKKPAPYQFLMVRRLRIPVRCTEPSVTVKSFIKVDL